MNSGPLRILIVDDCEDDAIIIGDLLSELPGTVCEVESIATFEEALAALASHRYDVCLLDYRLGGHTGLDLLQELPRETLVPIILLTGNEDYRVDVAAAKAGAADYLVKGHLNVPLLDRSIRYAIQRKESEQALRYAQRFAQSVVDAFPDNVAVLDATGTIVAINAAWRSFAAENGMADEKAGLGTNYLELCKNGNTPAGNQAAAGIRAVIAGEQEMFSFEYACPLPHADRWYEMRVMPFTGVGPVHVVVAHKNITVNKRAAIQLQTSEANLAKAQQIAHLGGWELEFEMQEDGPREVMRWSDEVFRIFGYVPGEVAVTRELFLQRVHPDDREPLREAMSLALGSLTTYTFDHRVVLPDGSERILHERAEIVRDEKTGAPLKLVGTVQDITGQKHIEESLRQSNELLRAVVEGTTDAIFAKDLDGCYLMINSAGAEVMGYPTEEILGKTDAELLPLEVAQVFNARERSIIETGEVNTYEETVNVRGAKRTFLATKGPLRGPEGEVTGLVGISRDITARKEAEAMLLESQQRLAVATESSRIGIWDWDVLENKLVWNALMFELYGTTPEEFGGVYDDWTRLIHPEDRERADAEMDAAIKGNGKFDTQFRALWPNGEVRHIEAHAVVHRAEDGSIVHVIGVNLDITERKQAEEALRISQERFEIVSRATNDAIWDRNLVTEEVWWGESFQTLFGYDPVESAQQQSFWPDHIHPDDLPALLEGLSNAVASGQQSWADEYRFRKADDSYAYIFDRGFIIRDADQRPVRMVGSMQDITARKHSEAALRASEARSSAVIRNALDCIIIINHEGHILEFNPAAEATFGYTRAEAMGQLLEDLIVPSQFQELHKNGIERYLKMEEGAILNRRVEMPARCKDGREITVELVATTIAHSTPPIFIAYLRDITERKAAEVALLQMRDELEMRVQERTAELAEANLALQTQIAEREVAEAETRNRARQQEVVAELGRLALTNVDMNQLLEGATGFVAATLNVELTTILQLQPDGERLRVRAATGWKLPSRGMLLPIDVTSQAGYSLRHKTPTIVADMRKETRFQPSPLLLSHGILSSITVIMGDYEQPFGTFGAHSTSFREFTQDDVNFLQATANVLAAAIERRRVETEIRELNTELEQTNEKLKVENAERQSALSTLRELTGVLERAKAEAEQAREHAEVASRAKSEFLSRMSHELRTPLNSILGFGQILEMGSQNFDSQQKENIQLILHAGRHLLGLINEVLDIARIEAGHLQLAFEPVDFNAVTSEVLDLVRPLATDKAVRLRNEIKAEVCGTQVLADPQRFKQVLLNLLSNAVKYNNSSGEVRVGCERKEGPVEVHDDMKCVGRLRLMVTDTGPGIAPIDLERLFLPFERLSAAQSKIEGTGIGLSLCKQLMEAMHGEIGVESETGKGSTFWLELPLIENEALLQNAASQTLVAPGDNNSREEESETLAGAPPFYTVLYIEDNLSNIHLMERVLWEFSPNIRLVTAMQGSLGLELAIQHRPDLVLLDVHLPDIMGGEVLNRLKANSVTNSIPVIVFSADATPRQTEQMLCAGASEYLTKPMDVARFLRVLSNTLGEPHRASN